MTEQLFEIPTHEESKRAFEEFSGLIADKCYRNAYNVFLRCNDLIDHIPLGAFPIFYAEIRNNLGIEEALEFMTPYKNILEGLEGIAELSRFLSEEMFGGNE